MVVECNELSSFLPTRTIRGSKSESISSVSCQSIFSVSYRLFFLYAPAVLLHRAYIFPSVAHTPHTHAPHTHTHTITHKAFATLQVVDIPHALWRGGRKMVDVVITWGYEASNKCTNVKCVFTKLFTYDNFQHKKWFLEKHFPHFPFTQNIFSSHWKIYTMSHYLKQNNQPAIKSVWSSGEQVWRPKSYAYFSFTLPQSLHSVCWHEAK